MPTYRSKDGVWEPALEKVAVTDSKGEPVIYEGKDRAALEEMKAGNVTSRHFSKDPELIARVRQVYQMTMAEYMKQEGYDEKTSNEEFAKKMAEVNLHKDVSKRRPEVRKKSGGQNTAGNTGHIEGDFGDLNDGMKKIK